MVEKVPYLLPSGVFLYRFGFVRNILIGDDALFELHKLDTVTFELFLIAFTFKTFLFGTFFFTLRFGFKLLPTLFFVYTAHIFEDGDLSAYLGLFAAFIIFYFIVFFFGHSFLLNILILYYYKIIKHLPVQVKGEAESFSKLSYIRINL